MKSQISGEGRGMRQDYILPLTRVHDSIGHCSASGLHVMHRESGY